MAVRVKKAAREIGAITAALGVAAAAFLATSVATFLVLPTIAPTEGKDLGYPFATLGIAIIVGLGAAVLCLKAVSHFLGRQPS